MLAAALLVVPGVAAPQTGGAPTEDYDRCPRGSTCTDPIVVGVGRQFTGRVELIAFQADGQLCLHVDLAGHGGGGGCGNSTIPTSGEPITFSGLGRSFVPRPGHTSASGLISPQVRRLKAKFGGRPATDAIVAQIDGKLLSRIGEEEPFGVFEVAARDCFEAEEIRLRALGRGGRELGSLRLESDYPSCDT